MSPPNNNPFVIPSLIPPLASSSGATGVSQKENTRFHVSMTNGASKSTENGIVKSSSSLLAKHRQDSGLSTAHSKPFLSSSPDIGIQRARRALQAKDGRRKALSPIENLSSGSKRNLSQTKKSNALSPFSPSPSFASPVPSIPRPSASTDRYSRSGKKRVLLFGETMESLFCLNRLHSTEEQYQLCTSIVDGSRTDDPGTWCRVLELARTQHDKTNKEVDNDAKTNRENLVRLHRRATLRFALRDQLEVQDRPALKKRLKDIFEIWLSYAKVHAKAGNLDEARRTFRFMEDNERSFMDFSSSSDGGAGSASLFYLTYADFEWKYGLDKSRARQILLRGIKSNAEPVLTLEDAMTALDYSDDASDEVTRRFRMKGAPASTKKTDVSLGSIKFEINPSPARDNFHSSHIKRQLLGQDQPLNSLKRQKNSPEKNQEQKALADEGRIEANGNSGCQKKVNIVPPPKVAIEATKKAPNVTSVVSEPNVVPITTIGRSASQGKPPVNKKRLALTSRLARKGLSGKAKRVDCSVTMDDDDFSSDDETHNYATNTTRRTEEPSFLDEPGLSSKSSKKAPSLKKIDLSYMWAWDPNKKGKDQNQASEKSSDGTNSTGSGQSTFNTQLSVIDTLGSGSSSGDSSDGKGNAVTSAEKEYRKKEPQSSEFAPQTCPNKERQNVGTVESGGISKTLSTHNNKKEMGNDASNVTSQAEEAALSKREALVAKANLEFLPLVHEDNILKVHGSTYAKLGVIGKGGSCKVYRALSKKCAVVAIKKVKLAGMDRKAIEGYANEISLLKRLRGNPAIIQMYDSEVDIQRKSIFVVMELGEVDLNHVLQQRALSETSRSLNMNFIRLTWQQMLSAVHCIHEERIIHSDLKPANFLFVRGALKLIDFGIAKAIVNDDTTNIYRENHIGTLNYMSPEAILDTGSGQDGPRMKIGRASDVWSLGCILYEMVFGKTPFYKLHFIQKLQAIVNPKHKISFPEDEEAEAAIDAMKLCLRRNPEDRPPIVGNDGLLNEHWFLHSKRTPN